MSEHEHHHEHHHEHDENCTCEHCHFEHNGSVYHLSSDVHDGASVLSVTGTVTADEASVNSALSTALSAMGTKVNNLGGMIGHIKAAVERTHTTRFSLTFDTVSSEQIDVSELNITLNAIVYGIDTEMLETLVKEVLSALN